MAAHQRSRLFSATAEVIVEHGHTGATVRHVVDRAGVSRTTFYEQFDNLHHCIIAAHNRAFEHLIQEISLACASRRRWPDGVVAAVDASLAFTIAAPARACLLAMGSSTADRQLAQCAMAGRDRLVELLRTGREHCPGASTPPDLVEQALIGGVISVVGGRLIAGQVDRLPQIRPELVRLLLTPYLGDREAGRLALAP